MASAKKSKGKATEPEKRETGELQTLKSSFLAQCSLNVRTEVRRRAVPGGEVIQFFVEPDSAPQRGYNQAKFEQAYLKITGESGRKEAERKEAERAKKAADSERLGSAENQKAIDKIVRRLLWHRGFAEDLGADTRTRGVKGKGRSGSSTQ